MILFDTNVVIDARDSSSANHGWSVRLIEEAAVDEGGGINAVTLAELCAGSPNPADIEPETRKFGLEIFDLPAAVSEICGAAYRRYVLARRTSGGGTAPKNPPPDFFIGAHAEIMKWKLATRDAERISKYFPKVHLLTPKK
ncbi:MAG TPA: PIN domain-containing protein [Candidatus Paceibacterota bacterium]|nr:PIN domain-containing protein [Candidatus Paceibacterota bacterium]